MNKKSLLFAICLACFCVSLNAQKGRLLLLKERGVTIRSFSVGDYINFQFSNQQWLTGYVSAIKEDTIQINQFALQRVMTQFGTYGEDTLRLGKMVLHINEIIAFSKDRGHYNSVVTNGAALQVGGAGYILLNVINSLINKDHILEQKNIPKLIGGAVAVVAGKLLRKANPNYRPIGKRFSLEILIATCVKNNLPNFYLFIFEFTFVCNYHKVGGAAHYDYSNHKCIWVRFKKRLCFME